MTLKLIKPDQNVIYDISNAVESVTWSGSILSAGRSVEFTVLNDPYDSGLKIPAACVGDYISFLVGSEELFYGQIFSIERSTAIGTVTYTAYDMMKNLLESNQKHVKGKSDTEHIFVGYRRQKLSQRLLRGREGCGYRTIWKILDQDGQAHLAGRHVPDGAGAVF